jgi:hypothetical protein
MRSKHLHPAPSASALGLVLATLGACDTFGERPAGDELPTAGGAPSAVGGVGGVGAGGGGGTSSIAGTAGATGGSTAAPCTGDDQDRDGAKVMSSACPNFLDFVLTAHPDCDDFDPSVQLSAFVDADGDGAGDSNAEVCVAGPVVGFGFAALGGDCNDAEPNIGPQMLDVNGDGVDRNCNGADGDIDCSVATWCPCNEVMGDRAGLDGACSGFDLIVFERIHCSEGCNNFVPYLRVANLGQTASPGEVVLTGPSGVGMMLTGSLAPGQITEPFAWPYWSGTVRVSSSEAGDCDPSNDVFDIDTGAGLEPLCPK